VKKIQCWHSWREKRVSVVDVTALNLIKMEGEKNLSSAQYTWRVERFSVVEVLNSVYMEGEESQ
jgi:hypothetical protein